ncbi:PREDICTED: triadin-like [Tarenaya hassleriana]|uniref:triadin-like n=1 Tax=Tarenaya hassleriana TaxID=28532 RepID=UPI00053C1450|nr:PREDICTED: triadin-like [Tarenaya hassleriana]
MDPKEKREEKCEDCHLESEEGSSGEGKSSEPRKEDSSNSFVSAEEDPEENPSEESRRNPREILRTSKEDTVGDEIQELEGPEEKIQETDAEIPEEPQEGNIGIEVEGKETEELQTSLPPEQVDSGKLDDLFTYSTRDIEESSDSEPRLIRKGTRRRVDFDMDVSVEHLESGKNVGDTSKQMKELPSVHLGQEKSKDAEIEVVADSATETEVLKSKEDDEPEVDSHARKVESKKSKIKIAEKKGKSSDSRVMAEQRARTRS